LLKSAHEMWKNTPGSTMYLENLQGSSAPTLFAAISSVKLAGKKQDMIFILNDEEEAGYFYHDLVKLLGDEHTLFFPSPYKRAVKYARTDKANEILRTEVISHLINDKVSNLIVTYPDAIAVKIVNQQTLSDNAIRLGVGETVEPLTIGKRLTEQGMKRTDYVYEPGEFAIRGSIIDVFSYNCELPYRIDFFGDEIDSIRTFDVESQLSEEQKKDILIVPDVSRREEQRVSLLSFMKNDSWLIWHGENFTRDTVEKIFNEGFSEQAYMEQAAEKEAGGTAEDTMNISEDKTQLLLRPEDLNTDFARMRRFVLGNKPQNVKAPSLTFHTSVQPLFHKNFDMMAQSIRDFMEEGYTLYILAENGKQHERLRDILAEINDTIRFKPVNGTLHCGFTDKDLRICVFTDHQIFDRFHKYSLKSDRAREGKIALSIKALNMFEPGDYVTHVDHGVGKFVGLVRIQQGDTEQEMMKLIYQAGDVVYVSIHSLGKVSKFKGREGEMPKLSKLGTGAWEKMKDRTKKKIKDIARDLIKLYSQRQQEKGYAFSADNFMQQELEAAFPYEDTPDQVRVTAEIKHDMESERPMDRLICGDVGFGKTEIAIRAAFKAACDDKQVAVLVPTTVLAYQHYNTFSERLKDFPVTINYLTRARNAENTRKIKEGLANGHINIVIGTHKLIGNTIKYKDLGLLIIDEEQKFGVSTKEKLRQLRTNIDTLTLSATPIPRTLQFSLLGARDLSVIQTPPRGRHPIHTEIHRYGHEVIADAINFEMSRSGQVFIVCNRIAKLTEVENLILKHVPDARIVIGHGQMPPEKLEKIIMDFINYEYDVLISTTIIENGVDIPNANTIIIDNAQNFGLSDLHQMRGRVGRGKRKAFCYLLAPPLSCLPSDSRRRLEAIENFSDLGSGIHIAMQDLDIRGAGNLLGAEQSGFIADLGYETYQKILSEAVTELKNEEFADLYADTTKQQDELRGDMFVAECTIDSDLPLFFPEEYIPGSSERMACYRELDNLKTDEEVEQFKTRMEDRFGHMPKESLDFLRVPALRRQGRRLGIERLLLKNGKMTIYFVSQKDSSFYQSATFTRSICYAQKNFRRCKMAEINGKRRMEILNTHHIDEAIHILDDIAGMTVAQFN